MCLKSSDNGTDWGDLVLCHDHRVLWYYNDVIIGATASQITSLPIVYSTVYSDADQRKHQSSASLAFVRGIHREPVNSPRKWPVTRKMFPFDDVIMVQLKTKLWCFFWPGLNSSVPHYPLLLIWVKRVHMPTCISHLYGDYMVVCQRLVIVSFFHSNGFRSGCV